MHVASLLKVRDEGQEGGALDAVLVELVGLPVGRRHQHQPMCEQVTEEPSHHECVRHVRHLELVEADEACGARDVIGNVRHRIAHIGVRLAQLVHPPVHLEHELVEVHSALARWVQRRDFEERVHQERLTAPYAAVHVHAARNVSDIAERGLARGAAVAAAAFATSEHGADRRPHATAAAVLVLVGHARVHGPTADGLTVCIKLWPAPSLPLRWWWRRWRGARLPADELLVEPLQMDKRCLLLVVRAQVAPGYACIVRGLRSTARCGAQLSYVRVEAKESHTHTRVHGLPEPHFH